MTNLLTSKGRSRRLGIICAMASALLLVCRSWAGQPGSDVGPRTAVCTRCWLIFTFIGGGDGSHYPPAGMSRNERCPACDASLARRLVERGVRFVQLYHGNWDTHGDNDRRVQQLAGQIDKPIAGLIRDLNQRGLLEDTLIVWSGEFGRSPFGTGGRDHHAAAFSTWMAGGGIKGGVVHGQTDELGATVVEGRAHVHDIHATILHQMGLDHERLTYRHSGRNFRLTDVSGEVIRPILQ